MIVGAAVQAAQSDVVTVVLALLNVVQTLFLADIAARSKRVRAEDQPRRASRRPVKPRRGTARP